MKNKSDIQVQGSGFMVQGWRAIKESPQLILLIVLVPFLIAGCGSPRPAYRPDAAIERNAAAARSAYKSGSLESASAFYQKALHRARLADQPVEIARMAYNLAACRAQMRKYNQAIELLDEAEIESSQTGFCFPEAVLLRAEILRHLGQTGEALATAESGRNALDNLPRAARGKKNGPDRLLFQVFLAELACDRNDGELALKELDQIDSDLLKSSGANLQAGAARTRGRALFIEKRPAEAAACFDNAAALYQKAGQYSDMAEALQQAGHACEAADKRPEAFNRHYRAARSLFICGENTRAQASFNKASELAKEPEEKQLLNILSRLQAETGPNAENKIQSQTE